MRKRISTIILSLIIFLQIGCTKVIVYNVPLYEKPIDWKEISTRKNTIDEYSKYLYGEKIFLDAGHGGEDRKNKSRNGEITEADVNLRVVLYLKSYLELAGAKVYLSRDKDTTVKLSDRSDLANKTDADIFISVHHNAPSKVEDDYTNYTSVYYHAFENDYEHQPCNKDLARYIQRDLSYVMNNPGGLGSFDGTYSDYNIYPREGFSVLRKTKLQAVLVECAFHTSKLEEMRLNNEEFNQIQAWGIFRGLAKYFKAGIPSLNFLEDSTRYTDSLTTLFFQFDNQQKINSRSIQIFYNKNESQFTFDKNKNIITVPIVILDINPFEIKIIASNTNGNHLRKTFYRFIIDQNKKIRLIE